MSTIDDTPSCGQENDYRRSTAIRIPQIRLLDSPLVQVSRSEKVKRMAAELVRFDSFRTEADALRSLLGNGYSAFDIFTMIDDARQVAMQIVVAREMSKP